MLEKMHIARTRLPKRRDTHIHVRDCPACDHEMWPTVNSEDRALTAALGLPQEGGMTIQKYRLIIFLLWQCSDGGGW